MSTKSGEGDKEAEKVIEQVKYKTRHMWSTAKGEGGNTGRHSWPQYEEWTQSDQSHLCSRGLAGPICCKIND